MPCCRLPKFSSMRPLKTCGPKSSSVKIGQGTVLHTRVENASKREADHQHKTGRKRTESCSCRPCDLHRPNGRTWPPPEPVEKGESPVPVTSFHGTSSGSTVKNPRSSARPGPRKRAFAMPAGNATPTCPPSRARKRGKRPRQPWQEMPEGPNSIFTLGEPGLIEFSGICRLQRYLG